MADHKDYLPGEAPTAHKATHQDGGSDEISVAGLSGETVELAAHKLLPTVHQDAPALILTHKGDASAHHVKYTDAEAEAQADAKIAIHAALPTVHQDAPALILTHKGDASAHHVKYTDAEVRALFSPMTCAPCGFITTDDTQEYVQGGDYIYNRTSLEAQYYSLPVYFPNSVTITKVTLFGNRTDADAIMRLRLKRTNLSGIRQDLAEIIADWTTGAGSKYDDSIDYPVIDSTSYAYFLEVLLNPNTLVTDVKFSGAKIEFTG